MQTPALPALHATGEPLGQSRLATRTASTFLTSHPVTQAIRGLLFSSLLWVVLAVGLYIVYTFFAGKA